MPITRSATATADLDDWKNFFANESKIITDLSSNDVIKLRSTITEIFKKADINTTHKDLLFNRFSIEISKTRLIPTDDVKLISMAKQLSDEFSNLNRRIHQDWNQYRHEINEALTGIEKIICDNFPNLSPSLYREYTGTMRLLERLEKSPEVKEILKRIPDFSIDKILPKDKTISEGTSVDDIYSKFSTNHIQESV